ncbi:MAG: hypothetical protein FD135_4478 [Comamonadaceae bacterium]|nr:MAG: hypothetical protein FD135_4478 [Comamonadaceae bacterium]
MTKKLKLAAFVLAVIFSCGTSAQEKDCVNVGLEDLNDAKTIRSYLFSCDAGDQLIPALLKLNAIPVEVNIPLQLRNQNASAPSLRVEYRLTAFFNFGETTPPDIGLAKLGELIGRMNAAYSVISMELSGGEDLMESRTLGQMNLAAGRAQMMSSYFVKAGLPVEKIKTSTHPAVYPNILAGRARDRNVELVVQLWRN